MSRRRSRVSAAALGASGLALLATSGFLLQGCVGAAGAGGGVVNGTGAPAGADGDRTGNGTGVGDAEADTGTAAGERDGGTPGRGTLRQDEITLDLASGELLIKVTPMADEIIRVTAPDTYVRLSALARSHESTARARTNLRDPQLFLVSVFSRAAGASFEPEDLTIVSHGRRYRPAAIQPVTPGWGAQRLEQQQTRAAVYVFDPSVDLESDLSVEYRASRNDRWSRIIPVIQAERARLGARGGRRQQVERR